MLKSSVELVSVGMEKKASIARGEGGEHGIR